VRSRQEKMQEWSMWIRGNVTASSSIPMIFDHWNVAWILSQLTRELEEQNQGAKSDEQDRGFCAA
jgi:hypothetical protein